MSCSSVGYGNTTAVNPETAGTEERNCLWISLVFFGEYALGKRFRSVGVENRDSPLDNDRPGIDVVCYKVDSATRYFDACCQCCSVDSQPLQATESWQ